MQDNAQAALEGMRGKLEAKQKDVARLEAELARNQEQLQAQQEGHEAVLASMRNSTAVAEGAATAALARLDPMLVCLPACLCVCVMCV